MRGAGGRVARPGLTLREIGGILNLTEGRISQILRAAMIRLRSSLSDGLYLPEGAAKDL